MRFQGIGRGLKTPAWSPNEIVSSEDISFVGISSYQNFVDLLGVLVEQGKATGSTPDTVLGGLLLEWTSGMNCSLRAGLAGSFSGSYYNSDVWGFSASAGDAFAVLVGVDTSVAFDVGDGSNPRVDLVQIRPTSSGYSQKSRNYKDPITHIITSSLTYTRKEFGFEVQILKGTPAGSPVAVAHTVGWIKLAEVTVPQSASAIDQSKIKDVRGASTWTTEAGVLRYRLIHDFGIDWGTGAGQVSGLDIPLADAGGYFPTKNVEAALQKTYSDSVIETYTPISGYTPALGDVVEIVGTTIRKAKRVSKTVLVSGSTVTGARVAALDATHAVVLYNVGLDIKAVVATVDLRDLSISFGTAVTVKTCTTSIPAFDVAGIDSTRVLAVYTVTGGTYNQLSVAVLSVSGIAITVNSAVNGSAGASGVCLAKIPGTTNVLLGWVEVTPSTKVAVVSISGTVPTINASATGPGESYGGSSTVPLTICASETVGFIVNYLTGATAHAIYVFSISGTTVTAGTAIAITNPTNTTNFMCEAPAGVFVLGSPNTSPVGIYSLRRIGSTTFDAIGTFFQPIINLRDVIGYEIPFLKTIDRSSGVFLVMGNAVGPDGNQLGYVTFAKRMGIGPAYLFGDSWTFTTGAAQVLGLTFGGADILSSGVAILGYAEGVVSQSYVVAIRRRNGTFGMALDNTGRIQRRGIVNGLSSLTVGPLGIDDDGNLTNVVGELVIGDAISATQVVLDIGRGI
jgi:hypothetical protein